MADVGGGGFCVKSVSKLSGGGVLSDFLRLLYFGEKARKGCDGGSKNPFKPINEI